MIGAFGPINVRGDSRDPEAVADRFLSTVHGESPDSVLAELPTPWEELGIDRIRELRAIKNNLGPDCVDARSWSLAGRPASGRVASAVGRVARQLP